MAKSETNTENQVNRRDLLKTGLLAGVGLALGGVGGTGCASAARKATPLFELKAAPMDVVRVGYVGVGGMGSNHVNNLLKIEGVQLKAVCDIVEEKVTRIQDLVQQTGQPRPTGYSRGNYDFVRMCETEDLDLVYTATPWEWHVPVCVAAMKNGKHAATEVPAAISIEECWQLVETAEKTRLHCVMMENCCYDVTEMIILNMVKQGLLGELTNAECGYLHDLRGLKFAGGGEALWRTAHAIKRKGDLYPTHGLGPIAQCMDINRGNKFDYLVSMECQSLGLNIFAAEHLGPDSPQAKQKYASGDVTSTLIRTARGQTIFLVHDTNSPRPYSRKIMVQGTKGIVHKYPDEKIYIEGISPNDQWEPLSNYAEKYQHPLRKALEQQSQGAGHGGMDFVEDFRLINALRKGLPTDMDVYDAAAWSAVSELSEKSINNRSRSVEFPDFTRGQWKQPRSLHVMDV